MSREREAAIEEARASVPQSPPPPLRPAIPPPRRRQDTGSGEAVEPDVREIDRRVYALEELIGAVPDAVNPHGGGALGKLFRRIDATDKKVDAATAAVQALTAELQRDREAAEHREKARADADAKATADAERRRAPWSRVAWIVIGAALGCITVGAIGGLGAYVAAHWTSAPVPSKLP